MAKWVDGADVSIDTIDLMQDDDEAVGGPPESIVVRTEAAFSPPFLLLDVASIIPVASKAGN